MPRMDRNGGACGHRRAGGPARGNTLGRDPNLKSEISNFKFTIPRVCRPRLPPPIPRLPPPIPRPASLAVPPAHSGGDQGGVGAREFADLSGDPSAAMRRFLRWIESLLGRLGSAIHSLPEWVGRLIVVWMVLALVAILVYNLYLLVITLRGAGGRRRPAADGGHTRDNCWASPNWTSMRFTPRPAGCWRPATGWRRPSISMWRRSSGSTGRARSRSGCRKRTAIIWGSLSAGGLQAPFRRLTLCFEPIVYGGQSATMAATEEMARTVEGLLHDSALAVAN